MNPLWSALQQVRTLHHPFGRASVEVRKVDEDTLEFSEEGETFFNVHIWEKQKGGIFLSRSHHRLGLFRPIHEKLWVLEDPYLCGPDSYRGTITLDDALIILLWEIGDSERIKFLYAI